MHLFIVVFVLTGLIANEKSNLCIETPRSELTSAQVAECESYKGLTPAMPNFPTWDGAQGGFGQ